MSDSKDETKDELASFTIRVSEPKDKALTAIQHLLKARSKQALIMRYIDEGMQRDLDPENVAKLFEEKRAEFERLRQEL